MKYEINPKKIHKLIAVPFEIREYLGEVSGEYLKVLFLIFSEKKTLNCYEIASKLDVSVVQVEDAIRFWKSKGILKLPEEENAVTEIKTTSTFSPDQYSTDDLIKEKEKDVNINMLFKESEMLFKRPLRSAEYKTLLYIYEFLNLKVDVILMVVDFCIKNNKSTKQILKMCEQMADDDITTHEQTEMHIKNLTEKFNLENQIKNCFGIYTRRLSTNEKNYIEKWTKKYCFKINLIKKAYDICVDTTGKLSFQYIEKILQNWKKADVKTIEDVRKLNNLKKEQKKAKKTSYNLDEILAKNPLYIKE